MTLRQRSYFIEEKENKFAKALAELKSGFKRDPDLRNGWLANMACRIYDSDITSFSLKRANVVAQQVFTLLFEQSAGRGLMVEGTFVEAEIRALGQEALKKRFEALDDVTRIQLSKGNWDYDPYMHGMANGLIMARSLIRDTPPDFLDAPSVWGKDRKCYDCKPVAARGH